MPDTGWVFPGTAANDSGFGTTAWGSTGNALTSNNSRASCSPASSSGAQTQALKTTNHGFAIPAGATIDGVEIRWEGRLGTATGEYTMFLARIAKAGTIGSTDRSDASYNPPHANNPDGTVAVGGASDLFGETLTESDVENSGFGCAFGWQRDDGNGVSIFCDAQSMKVYYTEATGTTISVGKAALDWTGRAVTLLVKLAIGRAQLGWTGRAIATLLKLSPVGRARLDWTGQAVGVNARTLLAVASAALGWTGRPVSLRLTLAVLKAELGWTARNVALALAVRVGAASFDWTGRGVAMRLAAAIGKAALDWTGRNVALKTTLVIGKAALDWTGQAVSLAGEVAEVLAGRIAGFLRGPNSQG